MNDTLENAIAFERYRLQIISGWAESNAKQDLLIRVERSLQRLLAEQNLAAKTRSGPGWE